MTKSDAILFAGFLVLYAREHPEEMEEAERIFTESGEDTARSLIRMVRDSIAGAPKALQ
jgi:hypothetical protein